MARAYNNSSATLRPSLEQSPESKNMSHSRFFVDAIDAMRLTIRSQSARYAKVRLFALCAAIPTAHATTMSSAKVPHTTPPSHAPAHPSASTASAPESQAKATPPCPRHAPFANYTRPPALAPATLLKKNDR